MNRRQCGRWPPRSWEARRLPAVVGSWALAVVLGVAQPQTRVQRRARHRRGRDPSSSLATAPLESRQGGPTRRRAGAFGELTGASLRVPSVCLPRPRAQSPPICWLLGTFVMQLSGRLPSPPQRPPPAPRRDSFVRQPPRICRCSPARCQRWAVLCRRRSVAWQRGTSVFAMAASCQTARPGDAGGRGLGAPSRRWGGGREDRLRRAARLAGTVAPRVAAVTIRAAEAPAHALPSGGRNCRRSSVVRGLA